MSESSFYLLPIKMSKNTNWPCLSLLRVFKLTLTIRGRINDETFRQRLDPISKNIV